MEKRSEAQRIAVIEPCVMTETALRFILTIVITKIVAFIFSKMFSH